MDDRRRFERVIIPDSAKVYAADPQGRRLGAVRVLGRGGMLIDSSHPFEELTNHALLLIDESESIQRPLKATVRSVRGSGVGFEFSNLDPDAAVEIGVIIGKYYSAAAGR